MTEVSPPASANFAFLAAHDTFLVSLGAAAERYFADDPAAALFKLRLLGEQLAQRAAALTGVYVGPDDAQVDLLRRLQDRRALTREAADLFHSLRRAGNAAAHEGRGTKMDALQQLKVARQLAIWFHRSFGNAPAFNPGPFVPPTDPREADEAVARELEELRARLAAAKLEKEQLRAVAEQEARARMSAEERARRDADDLTAMEQLAEENARHFSAELARLQAQAAESPRVVEERVVHASAAAERVELDEAATRQLIDQQLRAVGWEVDTAHLTYASGARPEKGKHRAIAEWPCDGGRADYVLFVGLEAVGVVEAKKKNVDVAGKIDQAKRYSKTIRLEPAQAPHGPWRSYRVPFLFSANGRPYIKQIETKSGVWFLDVRRSTNHARPLEAWYSPDGLAALLRMDEAAADQALEREPIEAIGLRDYQGEAVLAVERAIIAGQRQILLAMATGTGKTKTAIGLCYRLLKTKRVRRILFLVDRTSLGVQATDAFKEARIETTRTFADIYELKELRDIRPERDTRVHFATVQGLIKRVLWPEEGQPAPAVDQYDCIVIDECHRGYTLDREANEEELEFRSQDQYLSQYRRVLEHFDAIKIGLTATPALHTKEIFGPPVFEYSYRQAVVDGVLVDHEPPVRIVTRLAEDGISFRAGEEVEVYDPSTQAIDKVNLPDDVDLEVESFNRRVVTRSFNEVVCGVVADHIDPSLPEKTLVFCATDDHADMVKDLLEKAFEEKYGELEEDTVMKITGSSDQPLQKIRQFKNERRPNTVVTVDLLTTGIDVPPIANLVFLRRVRSRILYEQMIGRATRKCDDIRKEVFHIYDAVDLYGSMSKVSDMKPVVANPTITFQDLVEALQKAPTESARQSVIEQIVAKLQRKAKRLEGDALSRFETIAGTGPKEVVQQLREQPSAATVEWFAQKAQLVEVLDAAVGPPYRPYVSHHGDVLRQVTRGYGEGRERPEDYLEGPRDLTRAQLRDLKRALDEAGYTESYLRSAWKEKTNADIAASIIGFIRQAALGDPLVPYAERVDHALSRVLQGRRWTGPQRQWLERIAQQLKAETVVDREAMDTGAFQRDGGFRRIDRVFEGKLDDVLGELRSEIWRSAGHA
ncbi:MAG: type I restriction-modification system endonuclease [Deltaproteobacteria bacterium]|nr:type I restriction-modification system endonuclease [Deltaproteobacteria bacterium]